MSKKDKKKAKAKGKQKDILLPKTIYEGLPLPAMMTTDLKYMDARYQDNDASPERIAYVRSWLENPAAISQVTIMARDLILAMAEKIEKLERGSVTVNSAAGMTAGVRI